MTNSLILNPIDDMMILVPFQLENGYRKIDIPESAPCWPKEPISLIILLKDALTTFDGRWIQALICGRKWGQKQI